MKKMHHFTPIRLPYDAQDTAYRQAIDAVREWAGPGIYFGDAEVLELAPEGSLPLRERLIDRTMGLGIASAELAGSQVTYTATLPEGVAAIGSLKVVVKVDDAGEAWITSISVVRPVHEITPDAESEIPAHIQRARSKWTFELSENAHALVAAMLLEQHGVKHGTNTAELIERIESGVKRASWSIRVQKPSLNLIVGYYCVSSFNIFTSAAVSFFQGIAVFS